MKSVLFASAAVAAIVFAGPALAQPAGSFGVGFSHSEVDAGGVDFEGEAFTADGSVAFDVANAWTVTLEADGAYDNEAATDEGSWTTSAALTREFGNTRVGGLVGLVNSANETSYAGGLVAEHYMDRVTLSGGAGVANNDGLDVEAWGASAELRYFITDSFRVDGLLGYTSIDFGFGEVDSVSFGVGGEYQLGEGPFSVTAGYVRADIDDTDVTTDTLSVGLRYTFGGTLRTRDRSGADIGGLNRLFSAAF